MQRLTDTRVEAEAIRLATVRARSPEDRLRDALELSELLHAGMFARLRARYPMCSVVQLALAYGGGSADGVVIAP